MLKSAFNFIVLLPLGIVLVLLSVANRQSVTLALNPFRPEDSMLSVSAPFFVFLFAALIVGLLLGAFTTWLAQGKYRRRAREAGDWRRSAPSAPATLPPEKRLPQG